MVRFWTILIASLGLLFVASCANSDFAGNAGRAKDKDEDKDSTDDVPADDDDNDTSGSDDDEDEDSADDDEPGSDSDLAGLPDVSIETGDGQVKAGRCSPDYSVPGSSNIYLAGTPDGTSISYHKGAPDTAPAQSPLLAVPDVAKCFKPGAKLYFEVSGTISHGSDPATNADGRMDNIQFHEKQAWLGKSSMKAPLNALVGVFLGDADPSNATAPAMLPFGEQAERDYVTISPQLGQVFFIGDGKGADGKYQTVVVPDGVTKLYFGIMDSFEWNNNSGQLTGAILIQK